MGVMVRKCVKYFTAVQDFSRVERFYLVISDATATKSTATEQMTASKSVAIATTVAPSTAEPVQTTELQTENTKNVAVTAAPTTAGKPKTSAFCCVVLATFFFKNNMYVIFSGEHWLVEMCRKYTAVN